MKGTLPLDPTIDYREVVSDERFDKLPARVRASVMAAVRQQQKQREARPGVRAAGIAKNKQRLRNKQAKASRKRNRK
jgi:BRCT domain type II-containing protein